jgi:hypothetical protein
MDGLSGAASVFAVIDISAKIGSLCFQYSMAIKDAKNNIEPCVYAEQYSVEQPL